MVGTTTASNPRTYFACPVDLIRTSGSVDQSPTGSKETYSLIHTNVHGHSVKVLPENVQEVIEGTTFAFVAVDDAGHRMMVCDALANAGIPFVVAGLSAVRKDKRVRVSTRIVTAHVGVSSWRDAIPQVGQAGQEDYGSLELPDVYSSAASWAIQSWRKVRGLCPCGCGRLVDVTLDPTTRSLTYDGEYLTLRPSIGVKFACRSHYSIIRNAVMWHPPISESEGRWYNRLWWGRS